ncbi:MFS transporter [Sphingobium aromaticivastans]|uniref:MFS transporter n=1 Tax=Sphingobium aromaticivastans TaxID=1778665 RepID=UPI003015CF7D
MQTSHGRSTAAGDGAPRGRMSLTLLILLLPGLSAAIITVPPPLLPAMANALGGGNHGTFLSQLLLAASSVALALGPLFGGWIIARSGIRTLLAGSLIVYGCAGLVPIFDMGFAAMMASRFLLGLAGALLLSSGLSLLLTSFEGPRRERMLGIQSASGAVAAFLLSGISGLLAQHWGWRVAFSLYGVAIPMFLLALAALPAIPGRPASVDPLSATEDAAVLRRIWDLLLILVGVTILTSMNYLQGAFLLQEAGVSDARVIALVIGLSSLANAGGSFFFSTLHRQLGVMLFPMLLAAVASGALLWSFAAGPIMATIGCLLIGIPNGVFAPHMTTRVIARVPPASRAAAGGMFYCALFSAQFLNPFLAAPLRGVAGSRGLFLAAGIAAALCASIATIQALRRARLS